MLLTMLHSKIHRAKVTACELHYEGSLGLDQSLMDQASMIAGQQIDVLNINNGERFTTYLVSEPAGSGRIGIYGAAARKAQLGDTIIIIAYAQFSPEEAKAYKPTVLLMDEQNNPKKA